MIKQVLIITTETRGTDVKRLREQIHAKLNDLKPQDATEEEISRRLEGEIARGDIQVVDREAMTPQDMLKLGMMLEAGQRGVIVVEGEHPAEDEMCIPAKTRRRRWRKRENARAKTGRHTYAP